MTTRPSTTLPHSHPQASPRLLAPDVLRGGLLLLIAIANAPNWSPVREHLSGVVDITLSRLVAYLVDGRCYPVFAILFGYGLATLAERYAEALLPYRDAKRRLLRRLAWLLGFGAVHAVFFAGDILGPYAFVGLLCAPLIIRARSRALIILAAGLYGLTLLSLPAYDFIRGFDDGAAPSNSQEYFHTFLPLLNLLAWAVNTIIMSPVAITPLVLLGALIRRYHLVARYPSRPWLLRAVALWAPGISLVLATSSGLASASYTGDQLDAALSIPNNLAGVTMGLAYLAIGATVCRRWEGRPLHRAPRWVHVLRAVGQRSLTCYLLQTVGFILLVVPWGPLRLGNVLPYWGLVLVAVALWGAIAALAVWMHRRGHPGPADALLRRLSSPRAPRPPTPVDAATDPGRREDPTAHTSPSHQAGDTTPR